jgi:hypothetical protein
VGRARGRERGLRCIIWGPPPRFRGGGPQMISREDARATGPGHPPRPPLSASARASRGPAVLAPRSAAKARRARGEMVRGGWAAGAKRARCPTAAREHPNRRCDLRRREEERRSPLLLSALH